MYSRNDERKPALPTARITPDLEMHYEVDDYTDPWTQPETVLLLHGNAESAAMWFGWVPTLARHFRVVRTDMRGHVAVTDSARCAAETLDFIRRSAKGKQARA
jgi:pimeloyl-ACP methyl ester carboxylesterase